MRVFQNSGLYRSYIPQLERLQTNCNSFESAITAFLSDRFCSAHLLKPILDRAPQAFLANGDDVFAQHLWAAEHGLKKTTPLDDILLAQIEHHRTEVFYNLDPMRYGDAFLSRLPGHVRRTVAWRAAPSAKGLFLNHDIIVNNFPGLLDSYRALGVRAEYLAPAHDPEMDSYAARTERPVDLLFIGTYSRHHQRRAQMLQEIAKLSNELQVVLHLDRSRLTFLAETLLGLIGPLAKFRRPQEVKVLARPPVFGRELLEAISSAKIVINGAIDMAGGDRGNMRVWEALGCGAAMISDAGRYPSRMKAGRDFITYDSPAEAVQQILALHRDPELRLSIAHAGHKVISTHYSKELQWRRFQEIAA